MEAFSSVKMTLEDCLGTINLCLFWIFLTMVTLCAESYCGAFSLRWPFFAKGLGCFTKVLSFCLKMPGIIHPTGQLFMAVHLIGYGSVPILCSVFYISLNPWEAPGWQVIAVDADMKQVITSWLHTLNSSALPWNISLGTIVGANAEMVVVTTLMSVMYHLLHMCHVLIEVTITFWQVFVTLFF